MLTPYDNTISRGLGVAGRFSSVANNLNTAFGAARSIASLISSSRSRSRRKRSASRAFAQPRAPTTNNPPSAASIMSNATSYMSNTPTIVTRVNGLQEDKNQNIHINRKIKRKGFNNNMLYRICNMLSPKTTISGTYKPDMYNEKFPSQQEGYRIVSQNKQDICQLAHLGFDEFGQLFLKALSAPKTVPLVNHLKEDGTGDWTSDPTQANNDNEFPADIIDGTPAWSPIGVNPGTNPGNENVPPTNTTYESEWYRNQSFELLLSEYVVKYTITNQSQHVMYFEFMELSPKQILSDRYVLSKGSNADGTSFDSQFTISQSGFSDPLSCFERDIEKANLENLDYGFNGTKLEDIVYPGDGASSANITLDTRGMSLDHRIAKETRSKWNIVNKKIVSVNPGNQVDYKFAINGFQRHADWHYATNKLAITRNFVTPSEVYYAHYESIPTWIKQSKFLVVRSWVPSHVRENVEGLERLAYGQGQYNITASRHMGIRAIPRAPDQRHIQIIQYAHSAFDPDGDPNGATLQTVDNENFVNEETNDPEILQ